jgi:nitrogen regulatory protein P-II 2
MDNINLIDTTMNNLNLLTIIAEETLAPSIEKEIVEMGAKGYTSSAVSGKGLHGIRDNQWEGENIKIETIVSEDCCKRIVAYLQHKYFGRYAMIVFYHSVEVVRTSHFL